MSKPSCKTCKWADWERTPTGRISRKYVGSCLYPIPEPVLPTSVVRHSISKPYAGGIEPNDGTKCPCWEKKQ